MVVKIVIEGILLGGLLVLFCAVGIRKGTVNMVFLYHQADGGYSFLSALAEDNKLAVRSLEALEKNLRARNRPLKIITGHTGWTDNLDFAFLHRTELCKPFAKKYTDPSAPYDGYVEDDDTEESARNTPLGKVKTEK